jgi:hypothetical protein
MTALTHAAQGVTLSIRFGLCALLVILADFLFYGHEIGWTMGLFCFAVLLAAALCDPSALRVRRGVFLLVLSLACCAGMVETDNLLTFALFWVFFAALFTGMRPDESLRTWRSKLLGLALTVGGEGAIADGRMARRARKSGEGRALLPLVARNWLLPVAISTIFLLLFAQANPVIDDWISSLDWQLPRDLLMPQRILFWFLAGITIWGLLRAGRLRDVESPERQGTTAVSSPLLAVLFSREAVTRSLLIANAIFLAQNLLDANFLWAGAALPAGVTYAEYAHRGAYPLIVTALLAAAFVLVAMREAGGLKHDRLIRGLIYAWLFQNLVLVASSMWRTQIYVADYGHTYLRLAALLWMGLVLAGLVLIVVRIVLDRPSSWLIKSNLFAALALLLATCPLDMGRFIADYNVSRSHFMGGSTNLDVGYLKEIGGSALPALRRLDQRFSESGAFYPSANEIRGAIYVLSSDLRQRQSDWRRWTWRDHRLNRDEPRP